MTLCLRDALPDIDQPMLRFTVVMNFRVVDLLAVLFLNKLCSQPGLDLQMVTNSWLP